MRIKRDGRDTSSMAARMMSRAGDGAQEVDEETAQDVAAAVYLGQRGSSRYVGPIIDVIVFSGGADTVSISQLTSQPSRIQDYAHLRLV